MAILVRRAMGMQFRTRLPVHVRVFIIGKQPGCQFECGRIGGAVQKSNPVNARSHEHLCDWANYNDAPAMGERI
jgi:hypothetical protein